MCKMSNYIHKMLLNTKGTASIVFLVMKYLYKNNCKKLERQIIRMQIMPLVKVFVNVAVSTEKFSLQNHGGVTKSHCCDSQAVANDVIGNTVVTLGGTSPMYVMW